MNNIRHWQAPTILSFIMRNIMITGGAGFIGAHVAKALIARGDTVVALDDFNEVIYPAAFKRQRWEALGTGGRLVEGSILNFNLLNKLFQAEHFDTMVHLAALPNVSKSYQFPEQYQQINVRGTETVLRAASEAAVNNFIFAGSSSVYDDAHPPFREDQVLGIPPSPYGVSKLKAEQLCKAGHEKTGLPVTILRFFTVYGPWGRPDMAPLVFARGIVDGRPISVTKEERKRDFTYVDDTVAGIVAAIDRPFPFEIINLGRGEPVDLRGLIVAFEAAAGKKAMIEEREAPPGEMRITYADISKARKLLGYAPNVSVTEGAVRLIDWLKTSGVTW